MSTILKSLSFDVFQVQPNGRGVLEKRYVGRIDGTSDVNARENALSKFRLNANVHVITERREPLPNDIAEMRLRVKALETIAQNATLRQIRELQSSIEVLNGKAGNGAAFKNALLDAATALNVLQSFF